MADYLDAPALIRKFRFYAFGGTAPDEICDALQTIPGADADVICTGGELLYAHFDLLDGAGRALTAEIYQHAVQQGWAGFCQGGRAANIVAAIDTMAHDGTDDFTAWPAPETVRRGGFDWRAAPQPELS